MSSINQYYIVRKDIPTSLEDICSNIAQGSLLFSIQYMETKRSLGIPAGGKPWVLTNLTSEWLKDPKKVILVGSEKDFERIKKSIDVFVVQNNNVQTLLVTWPLKKTPQELVKLKPFKRIKRK